MSATVLVVTGHAALRYELDSELTNAGYDVLQAALGGQALDIVRSCQPHLVLLDLALEDCDGLDVARQLRDLGSPVAIIVLSESSESRSRMVEEHARSVGAASYIMVPCPEGQLLRQVQDALRVSVRP
ncbi:MAG: response regulator [Candidatus Kerfeldbacteria bacterium]|nr:response regulator [Candidatus Kerfeldbacteria bacterium]